MDTSLTKEQAERQIQELQDHINSLPEEVTVRGGDVVRISGTDYLVGKTYEHDEAAIALISLYDGNYWSDPVLGSIYDYTSLKKLVKGASRVQVISRK